MSAEGAEASIFSAWETGPAVLIRGQRSTPSKCAHPYPCGQDIAERHYPDESPVTCRWCVCNLRQECRSPNREAESRGEGKEP